ncbi:hypothetical protein HPB49_006758 [Dermacentor silvarum]|uniref:Uncharacterized protein n=1 Tax=Dermacentor silvarum TaxID=543639 RepID=A0ACB8C2G7_DERSI|nr:hypothetical protein HPB49_006758 [Dermacentor silvarum]
MTQAEEKWPIEQQHGDTTPEQLEHKTETQVLHATVHDGDELLDLARFSFASRVDQVTVWVLRFVSNLHGEEERSDLLTAAEIDHTHVLWLMKAQSSSFYVEFEQSASENK